MPSNAADAPPAERDTYHHGNLRESLITGALELIAERGPERLSLRELARRAGVSTAAPYRHFSSKEAVLAAVAEDGFRKLSTEIRESMDAAGDDPLARLRESGVAYVRFAGRNPAHYRAMLSADLVDRREHPELRVAAVESMSLLLDAVRACQAAGQLAAGDPTELALAAWSVVHGLASLISTGHVSMMGLGDRSVDDLSRSIAQHLMATLRVDLPSKGS